MKISLTFLLLLFTSVCSAQWNTDSTVNTQICRAPNDQKYPEVTSDGSGGSIIVWQDGRGSETNIYVQRIDSTGTAKWTKNGILICSAPDSKQPKIDSDGAGGAFITWFDLRNGWPNSTIAVQRVNSNGDILWRDSGIVLANAANSWAYPVITSCGTEGAIAAWIGVDGEIFAQKFDTAGVLKWKEGGVLVTDEGSVPRIVPDGSGGALISWFAYDNDVYHSTNVFAQHIDQNGNLMWYDNSVSLAPYYQHNPELAPDGDGGAMIVWLDSRTQNDTSYIYVQRVGSSGNKFCDSNGVQISSVNGYFRGRIAADGSNGAFVTWLGGRDEDVYVHRVNGMGKSIWPSEIKLTNNTSPGNPRISADGFGGVYIVWREYNSLRLQHVSSDGTQSFAAGGKVVCVGEYGQDFQTICTDYKGRAFITWEDRRPIYTTDIYAHQVVAPAFITDVSDLKSNTAPEGFYLSQNYPNPFNPSTRLSYNISEPALVTLKIFNSLGEEVAKLVNEYKNSGAYEITWTAAGLPSGIYFCRLNAGSYSETKKMILMK